MLFLPGLIVYTYFIGKLLTRKKSRLLCVLLCLLPCLFLAALRIPAYHGVSGFVYPTGFTVATLSAVSCLITFFRGEERASAYRLSRLFPDHDRGSADPLPRLSAPDE